MRFSRLIAILFLPLLAVIAEEQAVDSTSELSAEYEEHAEKHEFQAEVSRLMDIIINSLYTHKEVFLRELISNAADALEKARYNSLQDPEYLKEKPDLGIKIDYDDNANTLTIIDSGIGMTKADLINNLGTVAKSGTSNFLEAMAEGGSDANLIGQFGVGFYSAFLVADKVTVASKNNDDPEQHIWESSADASFSVGPDPRGDTLGRGTEITLHLKEDAHEYLEESRLKDLATKYSQFVPYPISLKTKKEVESDIDEEESDEETDKEDTDVEVKDEYEVEDEDEEKEKPKKKETVYDYEQVNTQKALWLRDKDEISDEDYEQFYMAIAKDHMGPLAYTHFSAEGEIEFKAILFIPKKAPYNFMENYWEKKSEIKLYVRRVLVADKFDELLPRYLNFITGVVDSDDLPLNVSREQLQQNKILKVISKKLVRKVLEMIKKLALEDEKLKAEQAKVSDEEEEEDKSSKDKETDWDKFYSAFGDNLKLGCYEDDANRSKIAKLLRFKTTKSGDKVISLDKYVEDMDENQDSIYYMSGETIDVMKKNPSLQIFNKKGIEVLLLDNQLDEPCMQRLTDYDGKKLVSIQKADVKLDETEDEKKRFSKLQKMYKPLTKWYKDILAKASKEDPEANYNYGVAAVTTSKRLVDAPCVVVSDQFGYTAQQEKIMRAQAFQDKTQLQMMTGRRTLELNPDHPVIKDLLEKVKEDKADKNAEDTAVVLFQAAMLDSGYEIVDPHALVKKVYSLMSESLGVDPSTPVEEVEVPEDEEEVEEPSEEESDIDNATTTTEEPEEDFTTEEEASVESDDEL
ncbi:hypothetical protein FOZ61_005517 [Perkinsus olseni]|uniref:Histidine kinase/HSP90-like ATPase domain-containing protein n=1 Tax=Perkinsus olseni TaxID=32597 RepID=A0A7J6LH28_PEROL|nr:hypothetical protein FOZ61_005517 [Perkinsus olseni]